MSIVLEIVFQALCEAGAYLVHRRFGLLGCAVSVLAPAAIALLVWRMF